ncbi:MAG TPA: GNAT family protein [Aeromicrobium sp.]|nr:GNAT family protein [Aeromicrobium sp.]
MWPASLQHDSVGVRSLRVRDADTWQRLRGAHVEWLGPWEASLPPDTQQPFASHRAMVKAMLARAKAGQSLPFAVTWNGEMVGLLTVNGITLGSSRSANLGYWVARTHAGRGIIPTAVALVCDHLFEVAQLHRIEIAIRPENDRSLRVVEKLGFTEVGLAPSYLHIAGRWRDHRLFQLVVDDVAGKVVDRLPEPQ